MPCPLTQTWDAAIAVRDAVNRGPRFQGLHHPGAPLHRHAAEPAHRGVGRAAPGQVQVPLGCQEFPGLRRSRLCTSR